MVSFSHIIAALGVSFVASVAWGIIFRAPRRRLGFIGLCGGLGWCAWVIGEGMGLSDVSRTLLGAFVVGLSGEVFARVFREPATVFITAGIVPLVPGAASFAAMQAFVVGNYLDGLSLATQALLAASAIAAGLAFASPLVRAASAVLRRR